MPGEISRFIALGASNLSRGFSTVVSIVRAAYGPEVQILAAHGYGRSYGAHNRVLYRALPGILESGLWRKLESIPSAPTRALITDIGNDILYGYSAGQILGWVEESIKRLQTVTRDITITDLPIYGLRQLSNAKFLAVRSVLCPACRLSLAQALETVEQVSAGLAEISTVRGARFFRMNPAWYGLDPVHIRLSDRQIAWPEVLGLSSVAINPAGLMEKLGLFVMAPERRSLFGVDRFTRQTGVSLLFAGRLWLY
jgi:hypothetical protein